VPLLLKQHDGHQEKKIEKKRGRNYCNTNNNLWFANLFLMFPHLDMLLAARRRDKGVNQQICRIDQGKKAGQETMEEQR
jgi:hypothetical protein